MIIVQYLVRGVTALKEGPLFQEWVNVAKGRCVPTNLLYLKGLINNGLESYQIKTVMT